MTFFIENYYLLALVFTMAYGAAFWVFLGRFDHDDPRVKALLRVLLGAVGWVLFDFIVDRVRVHHGPVEAMEAFRWLSFLFLLYPPASLELITALAGRASRRTRMLVYLPYGVLYLAAILYPDTVGGQTFGINLDQGPHAGLWNLAFRIFTFIYVFSFLVWMIWAALRRRDRHSRNEMLILAAGGLATGVGIVAARQLMVRLGPGFPWMGALACSFTCLAAFLGARLYGRLLSPKLLYRALLQATSNGIVRLRAGRVEWANQAMAAMAGREQGDDLAGKSLEDMIELSRHPEGQGQEILAELSQGRAQAREVALARPGRGPLWCLANSSSLDPHRGVASAIVTFMDISARKAAEEEHLGKERLRAAIETAGAVCHEMNQPLQVLTSRLELMLLRLSKGGIKESEVEELIAQVERLSAITSRLVRLTHYRTKSYMGAEDILDLDRSSSEQAPTPN